MNSRGGLRWLLGFAVVAAIGARAAAAEPIRVGVLVPQTGPVAYQGADVLRGFQLAMEEASYRVAGRTVTVVIEDETASPDVALTRAQKLVEKDAVHLLVGPVNGASALAMRPYLVSRGVPWISPLANPENPPLDSKYIFRLQVLPSQANVPFARWLYEKKGYRRMATMAMDFPIGRDSAAAFKRGFEGAGGQVVQQLFTPVNNPDFGPFLARLDRSVDAVYAWYAGSDAMKFDFQYSDYGLKAQIPLTGFLGITEEVILDSVKDFVDGVVVVTPYTPTLDLPANQRFVAAFRQRYGRDPAYPAANGYIAARLLLAALSATGGDVSNTEQLLQTIRAMELDTPRGRLRFDERGQVLAPVYVAEARTEGGRARNVVIDTLAGSR